MTKKEIRSQLEQFTKHELFKYTSLKALEIMITCEAEKFSYSIDFTNPKTKKKGVVKFSIQYQS